MFRPIEQTSLSDMQRSNLQFFRGTMLVGFVRISNQYQNLALQCVALTEAKYERIFQGKKYGAKDERLGLTAAISFMRSVDILVLWKLSRLGRSLK